METERKDFLMFQSTNRLHKSSVNSAWSGRFQRVFITVTELSLLEHSVGSIDFIGLHVQHTHIHTPAVDILN